MRVVAWFVIVTAVCSPVLTAPALAQGFDAVTGERLFGGFTEAEVEAMTPTSPNPYLSYLGGPAPDYRYWRVRTALDAYRRADRRGELAPPARRFGFEETEADGTSGQNDTYDTAEHVAGFGTGPEDLDAAVTIAGTLTEGEVAFEPAEPFAEDDGSISLASDTGIGVGEGVVVQGAEIGDGPHGATTGDFDYYAVTATAASQTIRVRMSGSMNVVLFDAAGSLLASNFSRVRGPTFPLDYRLPTPGTYYAAVFGDAPEGDAFHYDPLPSDPFDAASGPGAGTTGSYSLSISLLAHDVDVFALDLEAGDVVGVGESTGPIGAVDVFGPDGSLMMASNRPVSFHYPEESPLPSDGEALVGAAVVAPEAGRYAVAVRSTGESGGYAFGVHAFRPRTETEPGATQVLFVDFDGATIDAEEIFGSGNPEATLSPLADFMANWGLEPEDEVALIDGIMAVVEENLVDDLMEFSNNPNTGVVLQNSRDHADPGAAPYVSRLIVGGTRDELGVNTVGLAPNTDVGNFGLNDLAVILLDLLSAHPDSLISLNRIEISPGAEKLDLVAAAVGNITSHEAGHLLGLWHTDMYSALPTIQDERTPSSITNRSFPVIGPDRVFGTADDRDVDFALDRYSLFEDFVGVSDAVNIIAFGLTESAPVAVDPAQPDATAVTPLYPNPLAAGGVATLEVRTATEEEVRVSIYDIGGRLVRTAFEGPVAPGHAAFVRIEGHGLASGVYLVRVEGEHESAVRRLTVVR